MHDFLQQQPQELEKLLNPTTRILMFCRYEAVKHLLCAYFKLEYYYVAKSMRSPSCTFILGLIFIIWFPQFGVEELQLHLTPLG